MQSNSFWRTLRSGSQKALHLAPTAASVIFWRYITEMNYSEHRGFSCLPIFVTVSDSILSNNALNGTFEMTGNISQQLQSVNLLNNRIVAANITQNYNKTLV